MPLGRPRQFDIETALDRAIPLFWKKGYAGSSLDELAVAMGIHKPSLYAAFKDKETLFAACVDRYLATIGGEPIHRLQAAATLDEGLSDMFAAVVEGCTRADKPCGCMIATALADAAELAPSLKQKFGECRQATDRAIEAVLRNAQTRGQIDHATDITTLAAMISVLMNGLAVRARSGASREELISVAGAAAEITKQAAKL